MGKLKKELSEFLFEGLGPVGLVSMSFLLIIFLLIILFFIGGINYEKSPNITIIVIIVCYYLSLRIHSYFEHKEILNKIKGRE